MDCQGLWRVSSWPSEDGRRSSPRGPIPGTGTSHIERKSAVYFLTGRLRFSESEQGAPFPSALVIWGASKEDLVALDAAMPDAWRAR